MSTKCKWQIGQVERGYPHGTRTSDSQIQQTATDRCHHSRLEILFFYVCVCVGGGGEYLFWRNAVWFELHQVKMNLMTGQKEVPKEKWGERGMAIIIASFVIENGAAFSETIGDQSSRVIFHGSNQWWTCFISFGHKGNESLTFRSDSIHRLLMKHVLEWKSFHLFSFPWRSTDLNWVWPFAISFPSAHRRDEWNHHDIQNLKHFQRMCNTINACAKRRELVTTSYDVARRIDGYQKLRGDSPYAFALFGEGRILFFGCVNGKKKVGCTWLVARAVFSVKKMGLHNCCCVLQPFEISLLPKVGEGNFVNFYVYIHSQTDFNQNGKIVKERESRSADCIVVLIFSRFLFRIDWMINNRWEMIFSRRCLYSRSYRQMLKPYSHSLRW